MYTLWDVMEYACTSANMYFSVCKKYKPNEEIWKLPFKKYLTLLLNTVHNKSQLTDVFLLIYWITAAFSIIGLVQALYELALIAVNDIYEPKTFGNRTYEHIPLNFRRSARVCGATLNVKLYISLIYGLLNFRPSYILPWVVVFGIVIPLEIIYAACDVFFRLKFKKAPTIHLFVLLIRWSFTLHLKIIMDNFQRK